MKQVQFRNLIQAIALFGVLLISCNHEDDDTLNRDLPSFHLAESEKVVLPDAIKLPDNFPQGNSRVLTFFADGVQKYKAQAVPGSDPVTFQWQFVAPQADLYDSRNQKVGTHSGGPTWQLSAADSMFGQAFDPPRTAAGMISNSIDWLLLMQKTDKAPTGVFAEVDYVQRINTVGGKAPATPPVNGDDSISVPYTAIYRFSKRNQ